MKKILFICHESSRTGAPIVLLNVIPYFKDYGYEPVILIKKDGELRKNFESEGLTYVLYNKKPKNIVLRAISKIKSHFQAKKAIKAINSMTFAFIYNNTFTNGKLLGKLKLNAPVISHIHELKSVIEKTNRDDVDGTVEKTDIYVACAEVVAQNLISMFGIDNEKIIVHHGSILSPISLSPSANALTDGKIIRIGSAGFVDKRKGYDLFLETALKVRENKTDWEFQFYWVGGVPSKLKVEIDLFIKENKLDNVHFLGQKEDPFPYYQEFDIFFLFSREDPFPLVVLENALLAKPIIIYKQGGGMKELIEDGKNGKVVDGFDPWQSAQAILSLTDKAIREQLGRNIREKVLENHINEVSIPRLIDGLLEKMHK